MPSFRLCALPADLFAPLFSFSDADLRSRGIVRMTVDEKPGFPCRVSLVDAEVGDTVLLIPFTHHDVSSPYRGGGPIFVRQNARTITPGPGEIPQMFNHRLLSLRAYDADAMLIGADVIQGRDLAPAIVRLFESPAASYIHIHNAKPGCYNCSVVRA